MAEFIIREDTTTRLTLETDPSNIKQPTGCFISLGAVLLIVSSLIYVFLDQTFGWMSFFLTGCLAIFLIYKKIYPTIKHIIFDFSSGKIIRFNSIGRRTKNSHEILFSQISKVVYVYFESQTITNLAAAVLVLQDKRTLLVNEGAPTEIKPFAEKIANSLHVPIEEYGASNSKEYGDWVY